MLSNLPKLYNNLKILFVGISAYNYPLNQEGARSNKLIWLNSKIIYSMSVIQKDVPI